jgi:hypothetical protein
LDGALTWCQLCGLLSHNRRRSVHEVTKFQRLACWPCVRLPTWDLRGLSIVADVEMPRPESGLSLLRLLMAAIAVVLLVYAAALLVVIEFVYRHLMAAPIAWLLTRLGRLSA